MQESSAPVMATPKQRILRCVLSVVFVGHLGMSLPVLCLAFLLVLFAETAGGRWAGLGFLLAVSALLCLWLLAFCRTRRTGTWLAAGLFVLGMACLTAAYILSPANRMPSGNFSQHFQGDTSFRRAALSNVVPEIDQLKLGSFLVGPLDPIIEREQPERIRSVFLAVYRELHRDEAYREAVADVDHRVETIAKLSA